MSRGNKLDLFIGAKIDDGWAKVETISAQTISSQKIEPSKHFLVFKKEKRNGKTITIIGEFLISKDDAEILLKSIKKSLGCGGVYRDGWMEFQGELKDKIRAVLLEKSFRFKNGH